ncbi:MAG: hypothetical protein AAB693_01615 [Patescibacteria group bacterium]
MQIIHSPKLSPSLTPRSIQKVILKNLAEKNAITLSSIHEEKKPKMNYAFTRSIKNLVKSGHAKICNSGNQDYFQITDKGKKKFHNIQLEAEEALVTNTWDGFWRIIILNIPEERKNEREALVYLLKKANFNCIKNTIWVSHYPYENLFENIKKDLNLSTELIILVTNKLDTETNQIFLGSLKK